MLSTTTDLMWIFILLSLFFTKCAFTVETLDQDTITSTTRGLDQIANKVIEINKKTSVNNKVISDRQNVAKPSDSVLVKADPIHRISAFASEGGGLSEKTATPALSNIDLAQLTVNEKHSTTVKGRKGVVFPKVSPRKGVDEKDILHNNNNTTALDIAPNQLPVSISNSDSLSTKKPLLVDNKTTGTEVEKLPAETAYGLKVNHGIYKKPEYVSDKEDDDFDGIINTSTTGEDYIIIGIVIVIGIWFSVFGALIFYRRAGEYWDRRHYRRMDFLVEGMYND